MKICLLTYDTPHLKTAQVYHGLNIINRYDISFMTMPFIERKSRDVIFKHRPSQFTGVGARDISNKTGCEIISYENWKNSIKAFDYFIVCGSNIIDKDFANCGKILNAHSGIIPGVRGLDSLKWAIYHQKLVGNTLHIIDEHADAGQVISNIETPVYSNDTLESFSLRHYENEILMLINFEKLIESGSKINSDYAESTMRMPIEKEQELFEKFEIYKEKYL